MSNEDSGLGVPKGSATANKVGDYAGHSAAYFIPHHKLSEMLLYVCYAGRDRAGWSKLKSCNGILYASEQKVRIGRSWKNLPTK